MISVSPAAPSVASPPHSPHHVHPPSAAPHKARFSPTLPIAYPFQLTTFPGFLLLIFHGSAQGTFRWTPRLRQMPLPHAASSESPQPSSPCPGIAALSGSPSGLSVPLRAQCSPLHTLRTECWVQHGLDKCFTKKQRRQKNGKDAHFNSL